MNRADEKEYWGLIWEKFRAGDRHAFETIYNEYADALFAYGRKITPDIELAKDAIQDTFLDVYTYGKSLRNPESLEFYLYKTLKNILIRKLKEKKRLSHFDDFEAQFELRFPLEASEIDESEEHLIVLREELKNLDANKRELLFLKFNSSLTYKEIGELLNCKPDTVKKQVQRTLKFMRKKLGEDFLDVFLVLFRSGESGKVGDT